MKLLAERIREPEVMDDPGLETELLHGALTGLGRINLLSASARIVWREISRLAHRRTSDRLRVLDVATGGGDVPLALWRLGRRAGLRLELHGIDINDRALEFARRRAAAAGAEMQFTQLDALKDDLPAGYDIVISSLFLHHLEDDSAESLLKSMAAVSEHAVLINDLLRGRRGLLLAHLAGRFLTRSPVVRIDAVRSVRAAFSLPEIRALADRAGLQRAFISRRWPCRYLLAWHKDRDLA